MRSAPRLDSRKVLAAALAWLLPAAMFSPAFAQEDGLDYFGDNLERNEERLDRRDERLDLESERSTSSTTMPEEGPRPLNPASPAEEAKPAAPALPPLPPRAPQPNVPEDPFSERKDPDDNTVQ
jgi:hypothetical protein